MDQGKAILVTGASTGIGYDIVSRLSKKYHTYATVRKLADFEKLKQIHNITPVLCDVTNKIQIEETFQKIKSDNRLLIGLVNNAGIGSLGFHSSFTEEEIFKIFDVNVFGPMRLVRKFMNLLYEAKGAIVNIGSQGGLITSKLYGPYTMTKFALEAYTDSLRAELEPYGIRVSIVEPGGIRSAIGSNASDEQIARLKRVQPPFKEEADQLLRFFEKPFTEGTFNEDEPESQTNRRISEPSIVTDAVEDAIESDNPKARYLVGTNWEGDRVVNTLLSKLVQINDSPAHGYSRDKLVELLDYHINNYSELRSNN